MFLSVYDVMNILQEIQDNKKGPPFGEPLQTAR